MYRRSDGIISLLLWTGVIITYLLVEWVYNQHLLEILLRENISSEQFERTEVFGKIIASLGINLFFIKIFHYSKKIFFIGVVVSYFMLTTLFNYAINSFSDEFRYQSYYSMLYRADVIKGKDNILPPVPYWYEKSLLMSYFVFTLEGKEWKSYENSVKKPVVGKLKKLEEDKPRLWLKYTEITQLKKKLDSAHSKYMQGMARYGMYKNGRYEKSARKQFLKQSGGIPPDLTYDEFYQQVPGGKTYQQFLEKVFFEGAGNIDPIYGRNIPLGLNKKEFNNYLDVHIEKIKVEMAPDLHQIRNNSQSENPVALLVIPPISIGLSLLSIILNVILLVGSWLYTIPLIQRNGKKFWIIYLLLTSMVFYFLWNREQPISSHQWQKMESSYLKKYPILSYGWKFTMRFEPYICPPEVSPLITKVTAVLYAK